MAAGTARLARVAASFIAVPLALACSVATSGQGVSLDGFVQAHVAGRTSQVDCPSQTACDFPAAELRGQLKAEGKNASGDAAFLARVELLGDAAVDDTRLVVQELFGDLIAEKASPRLGRQVVTWG